jgi:hypothetical protein
MEYTIQQIFKNFGDKYLKKYTPSYEQRKAYNKILDCRTEKLGTRIYQCENCGKQVFTYNSCKDRHCPSCQNYKKEVWIDNHKDDILDITYFHVVLTVPAELHPIFYHNQKKMYSILFKVASETIMELCEDDKYLGAKVGITAMLHTWSQKANYHPHIHMIVTGGGLDKLGHWKDSKSDFLLPVQVISRKFRGKLLANIKQQDLAFYNDYKYLKDKEELRKYLSPLYKKEWVCYSKPPFNTVGEIYEYLGRYAFRVCMSNERIEKIEKEYVYFNYKDRKDRNIKKIEKIKGEEFIRKFLMHSLPDSFMKIRYYGLMASKGKKERINKLKILTKTKTIREKFKNKIELLNKMIGRDITKCKECNGNLVLIQSDLYNKSPPQLSNLEEVKFA